MKIAVQPHQHAWKVTISIDNPDESCDLQIAGSFNGWSIDRDENFCFASTSEGATSAVTFPVDSGTDEITFKIYDHSAQSWCEPHGHMGGVYSDCEHLLQADDSGVLNVRYVLDGPPAVLRRNRHVAVG